MLQRKSLFLNAKNCLKKRPTQMVWVDDIRDSRKFLLQSDMCPNIIFNAI